MTIFRQTRPKKIFMGKLKHGEDLLKELTSICQLHDIQLGSVSAIGAVQKARIGYYDQTSRKYEYIEIDEPMEITSLIGNISLKENSPFAHAHITLSDKQGRAYGGHLAEGCIVFACEFIIQIFEGEPFERGFDDQTGLPLWDI